RYLRPRPGEFAHGDAARALSGEGVRGQVRQIRAEVGQLPHGRTHGRHARGQTTGRSGRVLTIPRRIEAGPMTEKVTLPAAADFRDYAARQVLPHAQAWDDAEAIPREVYADLAARGWLGGPREAEWGGAAWPAETLGEFCAAIGGASM